MKNLITILTLFIVLFYTSSCINTEKKQDLTEETKNILKNIDDKIYINIYMEGDLSPKFTELQSSVTNIIQKFKDRSTKEIDFEFVKVNEKDSIDKKGIYSPLSNLDIHPIWVQTSETKFHKTYPYATIHFREKSTPILLHNSLYYDTIPELKEKELQNSIESLEYNLIEAIYLLQQYQKKKIAFLQGNGELDSTNTWDIRNTLSKFYDVDFFDLRSFEQNKETQSPDIYKQIERLGKYECIIIAKPSKPFLDIDKYLIDQYIMNGGKTIWFIDGTTANMNNFGTNLNFQLSENNLGLDEYLSSYGAKINHDLIQDEKCSKSPVYFNNEIAYFNWQYKPVLQTNTNNIIGKFKDSIITDFVSSIKIVKSEKCKILLTTSEKTNLLKSGEEVSFDIIKNPPTTFEGKKTTAVLIEGNFRSNYTEINKNLDLKKEIENNKMIIVSDGDIISNLHTPPNFYYPLGYYHFGRNVFDGNTNFILNSILYLCGDEDLIKIRNKTKMKNEK